MAPVWWRETAPGGVGMGLRSWEDSLHSLPTLLEMIRYKSRNGWIRGIGNGALDGTTSPSESLMKSGFRVVGYWDVR